MKVSETKESEASEYMGGEVYPLFICCHGTAPNMTSRHLSIFLRDPNKKEELIVITENRGSRSVSCIMMKCLCSGPLTVRCCVVYCAT